MNDAWRNTPFWQAVERRNRLEADLAERYIREGVPPTEARRRAVEEVHRQLQPPDALSARTRGDG